MQISPHHDITPSHSLKKGLEQGHADQLHSDRSGIKRPRGRPPKAPTKETSLAEGKDKVSKLSKIDLMNLRRKKNRVLQLRFNSPLPMFAHKPTLEELQGHPLMADRNTHRQAMQNGILEQNQLPPQFQSLQGDFRFPKRKRATLFSSSSNNLDDLAIRKQKKQKIMHDNIRTRLGHLKLTRGSAVPRFAHRVAPDKFESHPDLAEWHQYRERVERGDLDQNDLPEKFKSSNLGRLVFFRRNSGKKKGRKAAVHTYDEQERKKKKDTLIRKEQDTFRKARVSALGLHRNSATPIFARQYTIDELERHEDIDSWHHHRIQAEKGLMSEKDFPEQFRTNSGKLRFKKYRNPKQNKSKLPDANPTMQNADRR